MRKAFAIFFIIFFGILPWNGLSAETVSEEEAVQNPSESQDGEDRVEAVTDSPITITSSCPQTQWCAEGSVNFHWEVPQEMLPKVSEFRWSLESSYPNIKTLKTIGKSQDLHFEDLEDGIFFLFVDAVLSDGTVVPYQVYRIKQDQKSPREFQLNIYDTVIGLSDRTRVDFFTEDEHSGIDHYEVSVDRSAWIEKESPLIIEGSEEGVYELRVKAVDQAGHETIATGVIEVIKKVPAALDVKDPFSEAGTPWQSLWNTFVIPVSILSIGFLLVAGVVALRMKKEKHKLLSRQSTAKGLEKGTLS